MPTEYQGTSVHEFCVKNSSILHHPYNYWFFYCYLILLFLTHSVLKGCSWTVRVMVAPPLPPPPLSPVQPVYLGQWCKQPIFSSGVPAQECPLPSPHTGAQRRGTDPSEWWPQSEMAGLHLKLQCCPVWGERQANIYWLVKRMCLPIANYEFKILKVWSLSQWPETQFRQWLSCAVDNSTIYSNVVYNNYTPCCVVIMWCAKIFTLPIVCMCLA